MVCITLSRLLLFSSSIYPNEHKTKTVEILSQFLSVARVQDITTLEEKYSYNWITILPFVEMLFAPIFGCNTVDTSIEAPGIEDCQHWSMCVALLALEVEMGRKINRELAVRQGLMDFMVCLPWGMPQKWQEGCEKVVQVFAADKKLLVPKLASIAKVKLARCSLGLRELLQK